jgi:hypothetical protein
MAHEVPRTLCGWMAETFSFSLFLFGSAPFRHPNLDFEERRVSFDIRARATRLTQD